MNCLYKKLCFINKEKIVFEFFIFYIDICKKYDNKMIV